MSYTKKKKFGFTYSSYLEVPEGASLSQIFYMGLSCLKTTNCKGSFASSRGQFKSGQIPSFKLQTKSRVGLIVPKLLTQTKHRRTHVTTGRFSVIRDSALFLVVGSYTDDGLTTCKRFGVEMSRLV